MTRTLTRLLAGLVVLACVLTMATPLASAQEDPYGSTTTTTAPPNLEPTCALSVTAAAPGASVTATVSNVPEGQTVRILFDGEEVGSGTAEGTTTVEVSFVVPQRPPGEYQVTAVGVSFAIACSLNGDASFSVLAAGTTRPGGGSGGGPLPRTGIYIGLFVVVAGALLLIGRTLTADSKRRRRRASRSTGTRTRAGV